MPTVSESLYLPAPPADVWRLYFDPRRWPSWVDGFARVLDSEGYPEAGGSLRWRSTPAGRGTVSEKVVEHRPPAVHRISFEDGESAGELVTSFEGQSEGTMVTQTLTYRLRAGLLARAVEPIFVRPQVRRSMSRSLERLWHELEEAEGG